MEARLGAEFLGEDLKGRTLGKIQLEDDGSLVVALENSVRVCGLYPRGAEPAEVLKEKLPGKRVIGYLAAVVRETGKQILTLHFSDGTYAEFRFEK